MNRVSAAQAGGHPLHFGWVRHTIWILLLAVTLPLAAAGRTGPPAAPQGSGPDVAADQWRAIRHAATGTTQSPGIDHGVLIADSGQAWQILRDTLVMDIGAWSFAVVVGGLALFFLFRGSIRIEGGRSGETVERWPLIHRIIHWWVAVLFVIQMLTGLLMLYGKLLLIPLIGKEAFGVLAMVAKVAHNYLGPLFFVGLVVMAVALVRKNYFRMVDLRWLLSGGGMFGKAGHASAGFLNAGEKVWFWLVVTIGLVIAISGLILDFPNFDQVRETMQLSHIVHAIGSLLLGAMSLGHIYIGTLGTEGSLEGMVSGHVDKAWVKQHHNLWYAEIRGDTEDDERED